MPSRKRVAATIRIQLEAGQANPGKVGQSLGDTGINIMAFMAAYNTASAASAARSSRSWSPSTTTAPSTSS